MTDILDDERLDKEILLHAERLRKAEAEAKRELDTLYTLKREKERRENAKPKRSSTR